MALAAYTWDYDPLGRVEAFTNRLHSTEDASYAYDANGQVTAAEYAERTHKEGAGVGSGVNHGVFRIFPGYWFADFVANDNAQWRLGEMKLRLFPGFCGPHSRWMGGWGQLLILDGFVQWDTCRLREVAGLARLLKRT